MALTHTFRDHLEPGTSIGRGIVVESWAIEGIRLAVVDPVGWSTLNSDNSSGWDFSVSGCTINLEIGVFYSTGLKGCKD